MLRNGAAFFFTCNTSHRLKNNDKRKELMQSFAKLLDRLAKWELQVHEAYNGTWENRNPDELAKALQNTVLL